MGVWRGDAYAAKTDSVFNPMDLKTITFIVNLFICIFISFVSSTCYRYDNFVTIMKEGGREGVAKQDELERLTNVALPLFSTWVTVNLQ